MTRESLPQGAQPPVNLGVNSASIAQDASIPALRYRLATLGDLRLEGPDGTELLAGRRKELALLAFLVRRAPRDVTREELATLLWGERDSAHARQSLRQVLLQLRRVLGDAIDVTSERVRIDAAAIELDATLFEQDLTSGRLASGVARWRGDFLAGAEDAGGESFRTWAEAEREGLRRRLATSLDRLVGDSLSHGKIDEAVTWATRWVEALALDERAHRRLIEALKAAGRPDEALSVHAKYATRVNVELGREPSPAFMTLAHALAHAAARQSVARMSGENPGSAALLMPDMVGRDAVFAELVSSWHEARSGRSAAVVISGDKGFGKTRLCHELAQWITSQDDDACVLSTRAHESEREVPLSAARALFVGLAEAPGLLGASPAALHTMQTVGPTDASVVSEVLEAVGAEVPVLLVLDDAPFADAGTQQILAALLQRSLPRVMLVITGQPDALSAAMLADELRQNRSVRRLQLQPLDALETEALVGSMVALNANERRRLATKLHAENGGNPFSVTERVFALADDGTLALGQDGRWHVKSMTTRTRRWRAALGAGSFVVAAAAVVAIAAGRHSVERARGGAAPDVPTVAVGFIRDYSARDSSTSWLARALGDMLATNLARVRGLRVVSTARIYEIVGQLGAQARGEASATVARAARRAGATDLLQGALYRLADGRLRLDVQRISPITGAVRTAYSVEGSDPYELVDRATVQVAADLKIRTPGPDSLNVADVTTTSLAAYRLYEEGLRTFYAMGDPNAALRFFSAAVAEDSTFAMAAYYAWSAANALENSQARLVYSALAMRLADRASDRVRLLIRGTWLNAWDEPSQLAVAETLVARYPTEPDGHLLLAHGLQESGDFLGAVTHLRRVVEMDSLSLRGANPRCRACDGMSAISLMYAYADSLTAAARVAHEFVRLQPRSAFARITLAGALAMQERYAAAQEEFRSAQQLGYFTPVFKVIWHVDAAIRSCDFPRANRLLDSLVADTSSDVRGSALWIGTISLRNQGRLRDALQWAKRQGKTAQGQALLELGRAREAAALFDFIAAHPGFEPWKQGKIARHRAWNLTHVAEALYAGGDTARLDAIADTIEEIGPRSALGRDRRLHHHVRGLLWLARGRPADAEAELRRAIYSPTFGYTRTNLELGRVLLQLGRPREAASILRSALHGSLEASNYYVTHAELHELLGHAFDAAGERDSAAAHYRWVVRAWTAADPEFKTRRQHAEARLAALMTSGDGRR